jgi:hypothetical protein
MPRVSGRTTKSRKFTRRPTQAAIAIITTAPARVQPMVTAPWGPEPTTSTEIRITPISASALTVGASWWITPTMSAKTNALPPIRALSTAADERISPAIRISWRPSQASRSLPRLTKTSRPRVPSRSVNGIASSEGTSASSSRRSSSGGRSASTSARVSSSSRSRCASIIRRSSPRITSFSG